MSHGPRKPTPRTGHRHEFERALVARGRHRSLHTLRASWRRSGVERIRQPLPRRNRLRSSRDQALIPKGRFLTVALIGKCIDEAVLPRDSRQIIRDFLTLPQIDSILPGIAAAPLACACTPRMTVTTAASPFGDRFAIIGDAVGSRLNKDGLYSAHETASRLAQAVLHEGIDKQALARGYGKTVKWLVADR